jgi:DNA repair protein RadC
MKYHKFRAGERPGTYVVDGPVTDEDILTMARQLSRARLSRGKVIGSPAKAMTYLQSLLHDYDHEVFAALFLDNKHRLIAFEELFRGTIDGASVYPREVVKRSLELSAVAVMFVHNHPSGDPEPSLADRRITERLQAALGLMDIRVLDHIVVGTDGCVSMAQRGML